jgi:hypothetical protein
VSKEGKIFLKSRKKNDLLRFVTKEGLGNAPREEEKKVGWLGKELKKMLKKENKSKIERKNDFEITIRVLYFVI